MVEYIYTGFTLGYLTDDQIIGWADKELMSETIKYSNEWLIEISLANDKNKLIDLLSINKSEINILNNYFSLFKHIRQETKLDYNLIIVELLKSFQVCNDLFSDNSFTETDEKYNFFFSRLEDYTSLKNDSLPTNMDMPTELDEFLCNYDGDIQIFRDLNFNVCGIHISST